MSTDHGYLAFGHGIEWHVQWSCDIQEMGDLASERAGQSGRAVGTETGEKWRKEDPIHPEEKGSANHLKCNKEHIPLRVITQIHALGDLVVLGMSERKGHTT